MAANTGERSAGVGNPNKAAPSKRTILLGVTFTAPNPEPRISNAMSSNETPTNAKLRDIVTVALRAGSSWRKGAWVQGAGERFDGIDVSWPWCQGFVAQPQDGALLHRAEQPHRWLLA